MSGKELGMFAKWTQDAIDAGMYQIAQEHMKDIRRLALECPELCKQAILTLAYFWDKMGLSQKRFESIMVEQDEIRATWTEEQKRDFRWADPYFDILSKESFYIVTGGKDTLTLTMEQVEQMSTKAERI